MLSKGNRITLLFLVLSLLLAVVGQRTFLKQRELMWDGIAYYAAAMLAFTLAIGQLEPRPQRAGARNKVFSEIWLALHSNVIRLGVLLVGALCVVLAASHTPSRGRGPADGLEISLWLSGLALFIGAFVNWAGLPAALGHWWRQLKANGFEAALVAIIVVGTLWVRAFRLETIPHLLSGDEASMGMEALAVLEGRSTDPFRTGWLSHPTLFFFLQAAAMRIWGVSVAGLRALSPIVSAATALFLYLFARRAYGRWVAILASVFFLSYHYAIHFGRISLNNIWDPFFMLGALYLLDLGIEKRRPVPVVAGGIVLGLAIYFYMGARLVPIILAVYLLYRVLTERQFLERNLSYLILFALAAFLAALPLLVYFGAHPENLVARWRWIGIFPSGWVASEVQRTGRSMASVVFGQFLKAALAFNYSLDPTFHYRPNTPLLRLVTSILFVFGLTYAIRRSRDRRYFLLWAWFLLVITFGGALVENPPSSPRLVLSIPAVVILVALGATKLGDALRRVLGRPEWWGVALACILIAVGCYGSLRFYFGEYVKNEMYSDHNTAVADRLGKYARALGPSYKVYFFGAPRMFYTHASIPFQAKAFPAMMCPLQRPKTSPTWMHRVARCLSFCPNARAI